LCGKKILVMGETKRLGPYVIILLQIMMQILNLTLNTKYKMHHIKQIHGNNQSFVHYK
jgi:hypothetical protein